MYVIVCLFFLFVWFCENVMLMLYICVCSCVCMPAYVGLYHRVYIYALCACVYDYQYPIKVTSIVNIKFILLLNEIIFIIFNVDFLFLSLSFLNVKNK